MNDGDDIEKRELIKASAGSGKTYQLTDRFIFLLLRNFKPESIIALTFSRKAAGEFFDAILCKLAKAAKEDDERKKLEKKFGFEISPILLREKISLLLSAMNRLTLGTLDSFFFSILSSAPLEHGLAVGFDLMDKAAIREKWITCLKQCFEESIAESPLLIDAFSRARIHAEDREFFPWMLELAVTFRDLLDQCPDPKAWGSVEDLWPDDSPWKQLPDGYDFASDCMYCRTLFEEDKITTQPDMTEAAKKAFGVALFDFGNWKPGADLDKMKTGFRSLLKASMSSRSVISFKFRMDYEITGGCVPAIKRMSAHVIGEELRMYGSRTQGIYSLLKKVVASYRKLVLERGGVTFSDLPLLLGDSGDELAKLNREYRLDRKYLHWMLDEFQDTSPGQWAVIEPLVEEVINEWDEFRMFFCVGDQKQAIYSWRGGDSRLFGYLEEKYQERLKVSDMNCSWRSGKDVLSAVNQVFGSKLQPDLIVPRWSANWKPHVASKKTENISGHVAWWTAPDESERFLGIANLLREIDPVGRGLSCAILTQKRKTAQTIVDFLRRELPDMPVEDEVGALPAKDNGFSQFLLSLLRASVHPSDRWAMGHLEMCPFINTERLPQIFDEVKETVFEEGFAAFVKEWGRWALDSVEENARDFACKRMRETLALAQSFDMRGTKNIDLFIEAAQRTEASRGAMESSVRAMTIHGSKGLTFDMVIMPELDGDSFRTVGGHKSDNGVELYRCASASGIGFDWVLAKPKKIIQESDPFLASLLNRDEENSAFESLCKFYVGMTRPARGLYLFSEPFKPKSKSKNFIYLLHQTLIENEDCDEGIIEQVKELVGTDREGVEVAYHGGAPFWWNEHVQDLSNEKESESLILEDWGSRRFRTLPKTRPSDKTVDTVSVEDLIEVNFGKGRELGTEVHELFEKIEWWKKEVTIEQWLEKNALQYSMKVKEVFSRAMSSPEIETLFLLPMNRSEVWMERSFVLEHEGAMIQGTFDRVVLHYLETGDLDRAEIIDFKTDRLSSGGNEEELANRHRSQLESYRVALHRLTGLPIAKIKMILLFTSIPNIFNWS